MTTLVFLLSAAAIFGSILLVESRDAPLPAHVRTGLWAWITRGNWPAKVGGSLLVVGFGALLRYALLNVQIPPEFKLGTGIAASLLLGWLSLALPHRGVPRAVSLSLGGSAFGVVYMTAYAAFAYFHYLSNPTGLAALGLASAGASVYALSYRVPSLGVLSMIGAFLAPAFAISDPGPMVVYGYYAAASLLALMMLALRGWRPLMHLSLLFTIGGGAFLAWSAQYYVPAYASIMLPAILILAGIHLLMTVVDAPREQARWGQRMDVAYTVLLPLSVGFASTVVAPSRARLASQLIVAATLWAAAAAAHIKLKRIGAGALWVIGALFGLIGFAVRFPGIPWELAGLGLAVMTLAVAARRASSPTTLHHVLAGLVVLLGSLHVLAAFTAHDGLRPFLNEAFIEHLLGGVLMAAAGTICRRIRQPLDTLLLVMGILWGTFAVGHELVRFDLATLALVLHYVSIFLVLSIWIPGRRIRWVDNAPVIFGALVLLTAGWSAHDPHIVAAHVAALLAPLALLGLAYAPSSDLAEESDQRQVLLLFVPVAAALWAVRIGTVHGIGSRYFSMFVALSFTLVAIIVGARTRVASATWFGQSIRSFGLVCVAFVVASSALALSHSPWAMATEWLALVILVTESAIIRNLRSSLFTIAATVCVLLVVQADLLRWFLPGTQLTLSDLERLPWPALLSLIWAMGGCVLTLLARKRGSRSQWVAGATLLVGSALKLFLLDFSSLGQLANILAVIAAGATFLLVGWLAPMPPAADEEADSGNDAVPGYSWPVTILAMAAVFWFLVANAALRALNQTTVAAVRSSVATEPTRPIEVPPAAEAVQAVARVVAATESADSEWHNPGEIVEAPAEVSVKLVAPPPATPTTRVESLPPGVAPLVAESLSMPRAPALPARSESEMLESCMRQALPQLLASRRLPGASTVPVRIQAELLCRRRMAAATASAPAEPPHVSPMFRCVSPEGSVSFSDRPCPGTAKQQ